MGRTEREDSQSAPGGITPFLAPLIALQRLLEHFDNQGVIIGGIAASLLGEPRFTADVDVVILLSVEDLPVLVDAAEKQGLVPRIADAEIFARKNRVLLLRHQASGINIDISLGILPFEMEMVARSQSLQVGGLNLRLPTPEDLIILKAIAHRPQDLIDIQAIVASNPDFDRERVQFWVEQFGAALELPDLWEKFSNLWVDSSS
jgi:predicted nucleotidyltransferase